MSHYLATVKWQRNDADFLGKRYSREHVWEFDGGTTVPASASPQIVPAPLSNASNVDPEEAFVAALASCHMLFFLDIASRRGIQVEHYRDTAEGRLGKNGAGKLAMTHVTLRPIAGFSGTLVPDRETLEAMHKQAHALCFIANSVTSVIDIEL